MKAARRRLEQLMQKESQNLALAAHVHGRVDGLERKCMDGEQNPHSF
jgi:hypothetical protein